MSKWIRKGDKIVVIAGNEKGKLGTVLTRTEDKVLIQGINIRKKHAKRRQKSPMSDILEKEMPIHISNVRICDSASKPVKLKVQISSEGNKELFYLEGGKVVVHRTIKQNQRR